jgi:hypothetical protein
VLDPELTWSFGHASEGTGDGYRLSVPSRTPHRAAAAVLFVLAAALVALVGLWAGPASAQTDPSACGLVKPAEINFQGTVRSAGDGRVVFTVDRVTTGKLGKNLKDGKVTVLYPDQEEQYLKVGKSYLVPADVTGFGLASTVHTAEHKCPDNSTLNADGSPIATGVFAHATGPLVTYTLQFTVGFAALFFLVWALSRLARKARQD